jgi:sugar lactone lactonase YvrE
LVFSKPTGLCLDESGNLCVTDTGTRSLWFFDIDRKRYRRWERIGKIAFSSPVAVAKQDGIIYVADSGIGGVVALTEAGKLRFMVTDRLERPSGLKIVGGKLWVVDAALHRIEVFDLQGRHLHGFGQRGTGPGQFNYPTHLALTPDVPATLYVTDAMNFRVQQVDLDGNPLRIIGSIGDATGSFSRPKGVATDSEGNVYVVDALFDNIQIFDGQGRFLMHWGESGSTPGCFWLPTGIAIDTRDRIWVADSYNRRIQVFHRMIDNEAY